MTRNSEPLIGNGCCFSRCWFPFTAHRSAIGEKRGYDGLHAFPSKLFPNFSSKMSSKQDPVKHCANSADIKFIFDDAIVPVVRNCIRQVMTIAKRTMQHLTHRIFHIEYIENYRIAHNATPPLAMSITQTVFPNRCGGGQSTHLGDGVWQKRL